MRGIFGGRSLLRPYRANGCFVYLRGALPLVSLGRSFRACHTERSFLGIRVWFFYYAPTGLIRQAFFPAPHRSGFKLNFVSASWILLVGPFKLIAYNHKPRRGIIQIRRASPVAILAYPLTSPVRALYKNDLFIPNDKTLS